MRNGEAEDVGYQVVEYLEGTKVSMSTGSDQLQRTDRYGSDTETCRTRRIRKTEGKDRDGTGRRNNRGQILLSTERVPSYLPDGRKRRDGRK